MRRTGFGFVLAVLLSMFLVLAAQAQTDTSGSSTSTVPTLTIESSHVVAAAGEEVTFTVSASSAPSSALPVSVHVRAQGLSMDTRTVADVVLPAGATTVTLRLEQVAESIDESRVDVTLALAAGTGYSLGDVSTAHVSIYYPPATVPESGIESSPTPTPSASPPDAPSGVQVSATATDNYTVTWTAEAGETYRLEREAAYLFSYRVWQTVVDNLSVGSFTDDGLPCGLFYLYQVQAKVAGCAFGSGAAVVGSPQSCASTTSGGARAVRAAGTPVPRLRVVTDNPDSDRIQIRLLFFGPQGNEEQYTPTSGLDEFQADRSQRVPSGANAVWPNPETPGNSKYRWEESSPEFFWTGLECGADYLFRARGNGDGSEYQDGWGPWTDDAHADPQHGSRSPVHGSTRGCTSLTPPKLTNLMMGSATETSIVARWGLPPLPLGLVNFNLRYRPNEDPNSWINVRDDLNRTELSGTEFIVMGLLCSAGYKFQIRAAGNGGIYSLDFGEWSDQVDGSTARCSRLAKPELDVIPLPERKVLLKWSEIRHADNYILEARMYPPGLDDWAPPNLWAIAADHSVTSFALSPRIIVKYRGLAHSPYAYQFRVKAEDSDSNPIPSGEYSNTVIVIDTPILAVNGHSPGAGTNDGRAMITWKEIVQEDILGSDWRDYDGGIYSFRYRRLSDSGNQHTDLSWKPDMPSEPITTSSNPITGLRREEIYAIQLIYIVTKTEETTPTTIYSARDVYVWPSAHGADGGERVATFPLENRGNTYEYRICEDGFPAADLSNWISTIQHAFGLWKAFTELVTTTYLGPTCANYSKVIQDIDRNYNDKTGVPLTPSQLEDLGSYLKQLDILTKAQTDDEEYNEVIMVDDTAGVYAEFKDIGIFPEFSSELGLANCVLDGYACAVSRFVDTARGHITDILIPKSKYSHVPADLPGGDEIAERSDVRFNICPTGLGIRTYEMLIHESGHALGIAGGTEDPDWIPEMAGHPTIASTVMNYENRNLRARGTKIELSTEPDCSPHPLDIMAIYAIYQSE